MKTRQILLRLCAALLLAIPAFAVGAGFSSVVNIASNPYYALAATDANVTVNATPAYVSIGNSPSTWVLNGLTGSGAIEPDTIYYANPNDDETAPSSTVQAGECNFDLTNSSTVNIDLYVNCSDFTGGDANMTNSGDGSNGAATYGGHSWYSGLLYSNKVVMKSSASTALKTGHSGTLDWGAEIETRTNEWTGADTSQATMTISAQAS